MATMVETNVLLITFEAIFTSFFKDKKSSRNHETVGIKAFLTITTSALLPVLLIRIWKDSHQIDR